MQIDIKYLEWFNGNDTGVSSKSIVSMLTGIPYSGCDIPYDNSDFGRCHRMLKRFPELRERIGELADKDIRWMPFIDCWKELERLYEQQVEFNNLSLDEQKKQKRKKYFFDSGQYLFDKMQTLVDISRYLRGMRYQNSTSSMANKPPKTY